MEQQHRYNLEKLGRYLAKLSPEHNNKHFRMQWFVKHTDKNPNSDWGGVDAPDPDQVEAVRKYLNSCLCGTVACAIGHAPNALPKEYAEAVEAGCGSWWELSKPLFGIDRYASTKESYIWDWLFDGEWGSTSNIYWHTSWAAADRIAYLLDDKYDRELSVNTMMKEAEGYCAKAGYITQRMLNNRRRAFNLETV